MFSDDLLISRYTKNYHLTVLECNNLKNLIFKVQRYFIMFVEKTQDILNSNLDSNISIQNILHTSNSYYLKDINPQFQYQKIQLISLVQFDVRNLTNGELLDKLCFKLNAIIQPIDIGENQFDVNPQFIVDTYKNNHDFQLHACHIPAINIHLANQKAITPNAFVINYLIASLS